MSLPAVTGMAYARANWSRWVVDCPSPHCQSALTLRPGTPEFRCWDCSTVAPIVWPPDPDAIVRVLALRPNVASRNWEPGESVWDLIVENLQHGIAGPMVAELQRTGGAIRWRETSPAALGAPAERLPIGG